MKINKILITGSSGTIGTRLFEKLLERGFKVIGFDKKPNKWRKKLNNLTIIGDLLNKEDIKKLSADFDLIVHLAANARVYDLVIKPDLALENMISSYNILEFARKNKINKMVFSSSREVYGNRKKTKAREDQVNINLCESSYSASKLAGEELFYSYSKCYGISYIVLRFSNVYGMYDSSDRFIPLIIRNMRKNEPIEIFGKDKILDFTYIDDCVAGIIESIENFNKARNNTINIAMGKGEKLIDVANIIKKTLRSLSTVSLKSNRSGEVVKFVADISKAKKILNYNPTISINKGIDLSISWYEKNSNN